MAVRMTTERGPIGPLFLHEVTFYLGMTSDAGDAAAEVL
jgi:hypothetical protein